MDQREGKLYSRKPVTFAIFYIKICPWMHSLFSLIALSPYCFIFVQVKAFLYSVSSLSVSRSATCALLMQEIC